ncbi:MAG: RagB/SusD family nutrient uptake outer membrane protein [Bacteroidota bacterium]
MNSNKFFKYFLCTLLSAIALSSCQKYLDKEPIDSVPEVAIFESLIGLQNAITGAYAGVSPAVEDEIYQTALVTDEATLPTENNTGRGVIVYRWQYDAGTGGEANASFRDFYFALNRINKILDNIGSVPVKDAAEDATKKQIQGEALALRAYCHFELLRSFSAGFNGTDLGVTYMERSEIASPSRATTAVVLTKAKADLSLALTLLPTSFTLNTRFTRNAVIALQAQIALYEKDWDGAISLSSQLITAVPLATQAQFQAIWKDAGNAEVIWKLKRNVGDNRIGDTYFDRTQNKIIYAPSKELRDTYDQANDVRYGAYVLDLGGGRYTLNKYRGGDAANLNLADIKVFRTAEIYLIRAEAYAEKNNLSAGAADLNALRRARITGYADEVFATKDALVNAIMTERFKELAFEKSRYFDLKRRLLPVTRIPEDAINALGAIELTPAKREYLMPIPLAEINANGNMQQNTGF